MNRVLSLIENPWFRKMLRYAHRCQTHRAKGKVDPDPMQPLYWVAYLTGRWLPDGQFTIHDMNAIVAELAPDYADGVTWPLSPEPPNHKGITDMPPHPDDPDDDYEADTLRRDVDSLDIDDLDDSELHDLLGEDEHEG